ncbi:sarcosine oxidase subunit gamma [Oceaniglobus roseus]|uniref:sarcosine oxidase subunit gamma n=1 Tax=Oceaniglobus roseus TaxID=1737570 RepID=UPI000C7F70DE|nr:sarcosine oxidase subunit gamma family protein [Kandeliimicrobium roseum]
MKHTDDFAPEDLPAIEVLPPAARFSLRARPAQAEVLGRALGLTLPGRVGERTGEAGREAMCLGPDEWVILAPEEDGAAIVQALADAYGEAPHALADISDREIRFRVSGKGTLDLMAMGCPRDVSAIAPGRGARTVFDGATVVLWRDGEEDVRLDVWRSFAPHVRDLLETGRAELAAGL